MTAPVRIGLSRARGFVLQAHSMAVNGLPAVNVDSTSRWSNPYRPGDVLAYGPFAGSTVRDAAHAVEIFEEWAKYAIAGLSMPQDDGSPGPSRVEVARSLNGLRGHNLACWCAPDAPCHADVLLALANPIRCETVGGAA